MEFIFALNRFFQSIRRYPTISPRDVFNLKEAIQAPRESSDRFVASWVRHSQEASSLFKMGHIKQLFGSGFKTLQQWKKMRILEQNQQEYGKLKCVAPGTWKSSQGLIYKLGSKDGNRVRHLLNHLMTKEKCRVEIRKLKMQVVEDPRKLQENLVRIKRYQEILRKERHASFCASRTTLLALVDLAWSRRNSLQAYYQGGRKCYLIPFGSIVGTAGQNWIQLVVEKEGHLITAFPISHEEATRKLAGICDY